jgi:hypothetical protein
MARLARSIRRGRYNLLVGAGVSLDSSDHLGQKLPSATKLTQGLCALKDARAGTSLQRVFSTLTDQEIEDHLVNVFADCRAGETVLGIPSFLWRRVFTLNVDDALEAAYRSPGARQNAVTFNFSDEFTDAVDPLELRLIHLHGVASRPMDGFVFSREEYVRQTQKINPWMVILSQLMSSEPFIIAGTSLDEFDMDFYLAQRSHHTARTDRGPSILVEPYPDSVTRSDCKRYALELFEGDLLEFLSYIDREVPDRPSPSELIPPSSRNLLPDSTPPGDVLRFFADFSLVPGRATPTESTAQFLYGHEPTWNDLASNADTPRAATNSLLETASNFFIRPNSSHGVILALDDAGTGKTTVLKRTGFEMAASGSIVLQCSALSRLEPESTARAISSMHGPVVLLVDNFADQAFAISEVLSRLRKADVAVIGAERAYRLGYLENALIGNNVVLVGDFGLSISEARSLIQPYIDLGLLGTNLHRDPMSFAERILNDPIAVACCRIMNDFRPLDRIIHSLISAGDADARRRYLVVALSEHCIRSGLRGEIISSIGASSGLQSQFSSNHPLPLTYYDEEKQFVVPLNSSVASRVLRYYSENDVNELFSAFVELSSAIAPWVSLSAIRSRAPEARLAGRLFDYDQVVNSFLGDRSGDLYTEIQPLWKWNSRYWEQLALYRLDRAIQLAGDRAAASQEVTLATQHARHAVVLQRHPLSLTTLGKVLLSQFDLNLDAPQALYTEAYERIREAIRLEKSWSRYMVQPYLVLFRGTAAYLSINETLTGRQRENLKLLIDQALGDLQHSPELISAITDLEACGL